ncbi:glucose 1-dehydrogenase [Pseudomonas sp. REB1044]|uniref:SDR family NAD(P)-dependent oxidoreductase n=1 Tax=Pseudomonas sp. REB1044 TaxID=2675224 RepID=UPI00315C70F2
MAKKTVVVTGALSGIGFDCARSFAREGYNVVISGRDARRGQHRLNELRNVTDDVVFFTTDVTSEEQVAQLMQAAVITYGSVDVVIHSAGTEGNPANLEDVSTQDFQQVFDTNVLSTILVMKYAIPIMRGQRSGVIVNIASQAGLGGMPGKMVYAASKSAVISLTRSAALEVAVSGIRINAVAPGPVATDMFDRFTGRDATAKRDFLDMFPTKRVIEVGEVTAALLYLASDSARSVVGEVLTIDGGYSAS